VAESGIVIVGAGGHAMVVCDSLLSASHRVLGFIDDDPGKQGTVMLGLPVAADIASLAPGAAVAMGIGENAARRAKFETLAAAGVAMVSAIHPTAAISRFAAVGTGSVVMAHVVVNAGARIGVDVILNTSCRVDHHCVIGAHAHIGPGATLAGGVSVGDDTLIGAGAILIPGVRVGARCRVGAGAVVLRDVEDDATVAGNPARPLTR
jgi:sugar O-acyltransferase (sialic acid O-acetyltransferase NeuD family)